MPQITYDQTLEDILAFNRFHYKNSPEMRKIYWKNMLVLPLLWLAGWIFLCLQDKDGFAHAASALFPLLTFSWAYPLFFLWFYPRNVEKLTRKFLEEGNNQGMIGTQSLSLDEAGLKNDTSISSIQTSWKGTNQIVIFPDQSFAAIYVSSMSAHLIPRRAFPDEAAFLVFVDEAKRLQAAAKGA